MCTAIDPDSQVNPGAETCQDGPPHEPQIESGPIEAQLKEKGTPASTSEVCSQILSSPEQSQLGADQMRADSCKHEHAAELEPTGPDSKVPDEPSDIDPSDVRWSEVIGRPPWLFEDDYLRSCPKLGKPCIRLTEDNYVVKWGNQVSLQEAEAMRYVATHTSLKVPKLYSAYTVKQTTYIVMSYEPGVYLDKFLVNASEEDKDKVLKQLHTGFDELRSLTADYVGGFNRTSAQMGEFDWDSHDPTFKYGPWEDEASFNEGLVTALDRSYPQKNVGPIDPKFHGEVEYRVLEETIRSLRGHRTVMTHGDLNTSNIMVKKNLDVVVLDWECAGFYPEYWEWYKATWMGPSPYYLIWDFTKFLDPYWLERNIMKQLWLKISN